MRRTLKILALTLVLLALVVAADALAGWPLGYRLAIALYYEPATLPASQIVRNLRYGTDPAQRFDLFVPASRPFPMVVFAHGGGWREGDKDLVIGGADVYGNIGRFLAGHGIGAAIVNYRLLPSVDWRRQVDDVAAAVVAARRALVERGGRDASLFLMGHSAGAQLVTRIALDPGPLGRAGGSVSQVCGVIPVSGAALDLTDQRTWDLGAKIDYYESRFATGGERDWRRLASPMSFLTAKAPPFLVIRAGGESAPLARQSDWLVARLREAEVPVHLVVVPGGSHERIVLSLSRDDDTAGPLIVQFVTRLACGAR